ncbi:MAG: hypothetical protein JXR83_09835 [Deltaproteobacteria bacterium]|nr:hypothetical protein [Deltaproteobacteria bacterium]
MSRSLRIARWTGALVALAMASAVAALAAGGDEPYRPGDEGQAPARRGLIILPEKFLRGYDPITVYFNRNVGPGRGPADDGARWLQIEPAWPGAWSWLDRQTMQFRPAEPWPALARFAVSARGVPRQGLPGVVRAVLTTMMSPPSAMAPASGSDHLKPFRTFTLTFPQALPEGALQKMIKLDVRDRPGLADAPRRSIDRYALTLLPRASHRDAATYAITLDEEVPEGKQLHVNVSLALGDEGRVLWEGRLATRLPFSLVSVACGSSSVPLVGAARVPRELALACGNTGDRPQLMFSASVKDLGLTALKKLVRLEPAVPDLNFTVSGQRVALRGKFVPDVLYRMRIAAAPIVDDSDRPLADPGSPEVYFYLGWKKPFVKWEQAQSVLEARGPRMVPVVGYGDKRVDVRIYRVDPLHLGLWPFPSSPLAINEETAPPFPGEEPAPRTPADIGYISSGDLVRHLRLLGSPLVSQVVDLPLGDKGGTTHFGLDIGPLLDGAVGAGRPGTYLVGLRRLTGSPQRVYTRVQVTNLALTVVEERDQAVFYVRTLDRAEPVANARITLEMVKNPPEPKPGEKRAPPTLEAQLIVTDREGRALLKPNPEWWRSLFRIAVQSGEDILVLDPRDPPPRFANNHWSPGSHWLGWLTDKVPPPPDDRLLGFVFTERPIYRPGEKVYVKGFVRQRRGGDLLEAGPATNFGLKLRGPGGEEWLLPFKFSRLGGLAAEWHEGGEVASGRYTLELFSVKPAQTLATRTFQVEAYRIPTFEVQLTGAAKVRLDQPFKVKAAARYYAGGSVAGEQIDWVVTRRPYHYLPEGRPGYLFASSSQFARPGLARAPETQRRRGTLDDDGGAEIEVNPALDLDASPRIYRFEATVTGADNQQVSAVHEATALPPFVLGLKLQRYSEKAFELKPEIIAVGVDNKLLAGQEVLVRLYRRIWHSHLRETNFATGEAKYITEQEDQKLKEIAITTQARPVTPTFAIARAGVYVVELTGRDKLGRVQTLSADLYVGGKEALAWEKASQGVFELATDKKKYQPGDTAQLLVKSPFAAGKALVIVEQPERNEYRWTEVRGGKAVVPVKISPLHVPNLPLHVVLMRGRLGDGKGNDDRYRPQTLGASLDLEVEPIANTVQVKVQHPETARPGSRVDLIVTLQDEKNKPLGGEVTLWLVDEAVLSLAPEKPLDPLTGFVVPNTRRTSVRDTRNRVVGRLVEQEEEPGGDGEPDAEGEGISRKRVVRKNFETVPYYQATLEVGPSGRLVVPVTLSDDLTNFQVRAVAAAGFRRFGYFHSRLRVRLPVLVQPQLPRVVRQGDRFWLGGVARLVEGAEGPGTVELKVTGPLEVRAGKQRVELRLNQAASRLWQASVKAQDAVAQTSVKVRVDVTRLSDGVGDAFEVEVPILPDRRVEHYAYFDTIHGGVTTLKPFPEPPRPGTARQRITISAVPGMLAAVAGIDYLAAYPHGCLEQKISALVAEAEVGAALGRFGLSAHYAAQVKSHLKKLLDELSLYQDDEGLFGAWPGSAGSVSMTARAVELMASARSLGLTAPDKVQTRAVEALQRSLRSDYRRLDPAYRYNEQAAAHRALALIGRGDEHYLIDMFHRRSGLDLSSLSDLTAAMLRQNRLFETNLGALRDELWQSVDFKLFKGKRVVQGLRWRRGDWSGSYLGSRTATLAAVLENLVRLSPGDERLSALLEALLAKSSAHYGFGSTYENRAALRALIAYLEQAQLKPVKAWLALGSPGVLSLDDRHRVASLDVRGEQALRVELSGAPRIDARVAYSYLPAAPGDQAEALKQGFLVQRGATHLYADGSTPTHFEDRKGAVERLAVGDILELHTRLTVDARRYHVALVVPFAAGLELMNPELQTSGAEARPSEADSIAPTYVQRLDHEVRYYFTELAAGSYSFHFRVRATVEGSFVHPAAHAEQMYHEEVRGRGDGMRIVVSGEHEK